MSRRLATYDYAGSLGTTAYGQQLITKSMATYYGLTVSGNYANGNSLVCEGDLSKPVSTKAFTFQYDMFDYSYINPEFYNILNTQYKTSVPTIQTNVYIIAFTYSSGTVTILSKIQASQGTWTRNGDYFKQQINVIPNTSGYTYFAFGDSSGNIFGPNLDNNFYNLQFTDSPWHSQYTETPNIPVKLTKLGNVYYFARAATSTTTLTPNTSFRGLGTIRLIIQQWVYDIDNCESFEQQSIEGIQSSQERINGDWYISSYIKTQTGTGGSNKTNLVPLSTSYADDTIMQYDAEQEYWYCDFVDVQLSLVHTNYFSFGNSDMVCDTGQADLYMSNGTDRVITTIVLNEESDNNNTYKADDYYLEYINSNEMTNPSGYDIQFPSNGGNCYEYWVPMDDQIVD